jgi:hypothetical protein
MIRGIQFEIPNARGTYLHDILHNLNIWNYIWKVDPLESYKSLTLSQSQLLFPSDKLILTSEELYNIISDGKNHYLIFVDLKAFLSEKAVQHIRSYEEYLESDCQFVLLIVDSSEVYIFAKKQEIIQHLFTIASANGYKNIEYLTDETAPLIRFE